MPEFPRRRFIDWFLSSALGAFLVSVLYPVARFLSPPQVPESTTSQVDAGPVNDPEFREKAYKIVRFGNEPVIVVRAGENDFRAFAATCTHLDCIVEYRQGERLLWCNCHNGVYDLTGKNIAGPPPRPLEVYQVHLVQADGGQPATVVVERG